MILLTLATATILTLTSTSMTEAHCYKIWKFPKQQRCFTALVQGQKSTGKVEKSGTVREQIDIPVPLLDFAVCPEGDERMLGIARIRDLLNTK